MIIVAGRLQVAPEDREHYLAECQEVVRLAREARGCLDFVLGADLLDPSRINVLERWETRAEVESFRGSGPSEEQATAIVDAAVVEYDVSGERGL